VFGAYTGAVRDFRDGGAPTLAVTYDTPDLNFASVVTETTPCRLRVWIYNFNDEPMPIGLRPWQLLPGVYVLNAGHPVPGEKPVQNRYTWTSPVEVVHKHPGTPVWIDVPPHKEWVVDFRLRRAIDRPDRLPDLAVARRDVRVNDGRVSVTVHNIGSAQAAAFDVAVQVAPSDEWETVARTEVAGLPAIADFEPVRRQVTLTVPPGKMASSWRIALDPDEKVEECYELNNVVTMTP
jgi:hypothetical protein